MKPLFRLIAVLLFTFLTSVSFTHATTSPVQEERLIRTVIFSRHGVRSPTQTTATLNQWANKPWPACQSNPENLPVAARHWSRHSGQHLSPF